MVLFLDRKLLKFGVLYHRIEEIGPLIAAGILVQGTGNAAQKISLKFVGSRKVNALLRDFDKWETAVGYRKKTVIN